MATDHPEQSDVRARLASVRRFYNEVRHPDFVAKPTRQWHMRRLARIVGVKPGEQVLDVGCGSGDWLLPVSKLGAVATGTDISSVAIAVAQERVPEGRFHVGDAASLPYGDGEFDVVTAIGSLEHFLEPEEALREMVRVAKPDARFLFVVPNKDFLLRRLRLFRGTRQVEIHEEPRTLEGWRELFEQSGLRVEKCWADLHVLSWAWIIRARAMMVPLRALQAVVLPLWPLRWQYQLCFRCAKSGR